MLRGKPVVSDLYCRRKDRSDTHPGIACNETGDKVAAICGERASIPWLEGRKERDEQVEASEMQICAMMRLSADCLTAW